VTDDRSTAAVQREVRRPTGPVDDHRTTMTATSLHGHGPSRPGLHVDLVDGRLEASGRRVRFDPSTPDGLLVAYLRLVRKLRDVPRDPSFVLRRSDVLALAEVLRWDAVDVLDQLGELMGVTVTERRTMVTSFAAGALLIAVATGAAALAPGDAPDPVVATADASDVTTPADDPVDRWLLGEFESDTSEAGDASSEASDTSEAAVAAAPAAPPASGGSSSGPVVSDRPSAPARDREGPRLALGPGDEVDVTQPGTDIDLPLVDDDVEIIQPGADIDLPADEDDDVEIIQPGADIDLPADEDDDVEIVQPGADIDIPTDREHGLPPAD
jgi:hypothetical protein